MLGNLVLAFLLFNGLFSKNFSEENDVLKPRSVVICACSIVLPQILLCLVYLAQMQQ